MENATSSFLLGFLCTIGLFSLCLLVVVGIKAIILSIKESFFTKPQPEAPPQPAPIKRKRKRKPKPTTVSQPIRSIEIDPDLIDKIYVKKIS